MKEATQKRVGRLALAAAITIFLIFSSGCKKAPTAAEDTFFAMDTVITFRIFGTEEDLSAAKDIVISLEKKLSVTAEGSFIRELNSAKEAEADEETAALLKRCAYLSELTGGYFDVTIYPIVKAWGFTTGNYKVPTDEEIAALLPLVDYAKVSVDGTSVKLPAGFETDLGGIAKGYCSDKIAEELAKRGVKSGIINLGGNVCAIGSKPDGSEWKVAIKDPAGDGYAGILKIKDKSVVTSGAYERYFEENGVTYGHIIDPKSGKPASGLLSVTVVGEDGTACDALSTALFAMGPEKAVKFAKDNSIGCIIIAKDKIYISKSLAGIFSPSGIYAQMQTETI